MNDSEVDKILKEINENKNKKKEELFNKYEENQNNKTKDFTSRIGSDGLHLNFTGSATGQWDAYTLNFDKSKKYSSLEIEFEVIKGNCKQFQYEILFLDTSDEVLVKRFKEKRRSHPLAPGGRVITGIELERQKLRDVKDKADVIIDTSKYAIKDLREEMARKFGDKEMPEKQMAITILSFGFKYGIPVDSDLVFDVRFIPNPFYIPELKPFSGNDEPVKNYVMEQTETQTFLQKANDMFEFLIPNYQKEGKRQLIISIGCTGGRHRSVAIANSIYETLRANNHDVYIEHRDIKEDVHKGDKKL